MSKNLRMKLNICIFAILIAIYCLPVCGADGFAGGNGSEEIPYLVSTPNQLFYVSWYPNKHFLQINDIDMTSATDVGGDYYDDGNGWLPIGEDAMLPFSGTYDGGGYKIIGVKSNTTAIGSNLYAGLFGYNTGIIKNLGVVDSNISGISTTSSLYIGGIVGYNDGAITNCYTNNDIIGVASRGEFIVYSGGIAGYNSTNGTISSSYNLGEISATSNTNTTTTAGAYSGGISGYNSGNILRSNNMGVVIGVSTNLNSYGYRAETYQGGITGYNTGKVSDSYNSGTVLGTASSRSYSSMRCYSGGIVGYHTSQAAVISNSYNTGDIYGTATYSSTTGYSYVGGIVGYQMNAASILNCYNSGNLSAMATTGYLYIGGVSGYNANTSVTVENSYWNSSSTQTKNNTSIDIALKLGIGNSATPSGTTARTTTQMKSPLFLNMLNQNAGDNDDWFLTNSLNNGYPIFAYQIKLDSIITPNIESGEYDESFYLELSGNLSDFDIFYTVDNTDPTEFGKKYTTPIYISSDTIIKAILKKDEIFSNIFSFDYTINKDSIYGDITITSPPKNQNNIKISTQNLNDVTVVNLDIMNFKVDTEANVIIAVYDNNGTLISITYKSNMDILKGRQLTSITLTEKISVAADNIKIFIWNNDLTPYTMWNLKDK